MVLSYSRQIVLRLQDGHCIFFSEEYIHGYMYGKAEEGLAEAKY
jgi:hypothetical protein